MTRRATMALFDTDIAILECGPSAAIPIKQAWPLPGARMFVNLESISSVRANCRWAIRT